MSGGGEYEPKDSRKVVGTKGDPDKSWREQENPKTDKGEYEPEDSRNVTGQPASTDERWTDKEKRPPLASGQTPDGPSRD